MRNLSLLLCFLFLAACNPQVNNPPEFIDIKELIPDIEIELRYYSSQNFVGDTIDGYYANRCYMTKETALALHKVQEELSKQGMGLKIFDAYRPQMAVDHFMRWAKNEDDTTMKSVYYPRISKERLIPEGYIAQKSGHSRGSTVDLTIIHTSGEQSEIELDMGTAWDYFGPASWVNNTNLSNEQLANRELLQSLMKENGFKPLPEEWWHFTLENEPFPDRYFNFPIE